MHHKLDQRRRKHPGVKPYWYERHKHIQDVAKESTFFRNSIQGTVVGPLDSSWVI